MKPANLIHWFVAAAFAASCTFAQTPPLAALPQRAPPALRAVPPKPEEINEARQLLGALGFWVNSAEATAVSASKPNQKFDASLRHALIAFQKLADRPRTGALTPDELQALREAKHVKALESGYAHLEIDLAHQVLLVVDGCGADLRILPISSGSGDWFTEGGRTRRAVTPTGRFAVQRKIAGWRKSALGLLYYPNYIYGGIAIHGNPSVPTQPASHGCIRIPMFASQALADLAVIGLPVIVHDGSLPVEKVALAAVQKTTYGQH